MKMIANSKGEYSGTAVAGRRIRSLRTNTDVNAAQIRVHTKNAIVTLEGLVANDTEKDMAEFDAWYVFGVDKVINALVVRE
ncbi:MAG: BON domain-containing protein [Deltaproteobacteria bacterium]|nr:BON domain-containing protein [Deltaproteobacteria bacterium]